MPVHRTGPLAHFLDLGIANGIVSRLTALEPRLSLVERFAHGGQLTRSERNMREGIDIMNGRSADSFGRLSPRGPFALESEEMAIVSLPYESLPERSISNQSFLNDSDPILVHVIRIDVILIDMERPWPPGNRYIDHASPTSNKAL